MAKKDTATKTLKGMKQWAKDLRYHGHGFQCTVCGKKLFRTAHEAAIHCMPQTIVLPADEFSQEALEELRTALRKFGVYLGDVETEYFGEQVSDTWTLYVARRSISKTKLNEMFALEE